MAQTRSLAKEHVYKLQAGTQTTDLLTKLTVSKLNRPKQNAATSSKHIVPQADTMIKGLSTAPKCLILNRKSSPKQKLTSQNSNRNLNFASININYHDLLPNKHFAGELCVPEFPDLNNAWREQVMAHRVVIYHLVAVACE